MATAAAAWAMISSIPMASPSKGGGSGRFSAIAANRVGSDSTMRSSKKRAISVSNAVTWPWTLSMACSMTEAWCSSCVSRPALRAVMRWSVSSLIRAISAFCHSRMLGDVVVGPLAQVRGEPAERPWMSSV